MFICNTTIHTIYSLDHVLGTSGYFFKKNKHIQMFVPSCRHSYGVIFINFYAHFSPFLVFSYDGLGVLKG
jgi:hypothetical protein